MNKRLNEWKARSLQAIRRLLRSQGAAAAATATTLVLPGPVGAIASLPIAAGAAQILGRTLGPGEEIRLEQAVLAAQEKLRELSHLGYELRSDGFFDSQGNYPSDFEE